MPVYWEFRARDVCGVTAARHEFVAHMRRLTADEVQIEAATLVFGELIANAIKYGEDPISASLEGRGDFARLVVEDGGTGFAREHLRVAEPTATGGRGFAIATTLAHAIHLEKLPNRFRIVVELTIAPAG